MTGFGEHLFEASEALKLWEEGTWALDLAEDAAGADTKIISTVPQRNRPRSRSKQVGGQGRKRGKSDD